MEPIAIIGMACRFPGADSLDEFWDLLKNGRDSIGEVPPQRWDVDHYFSTNPHDPGKMSTRWGGFIKGVEKFDANFFGISPREAVQMDPQQRLLMEVAWEALEDAAQVPERLAGTKTGVFVGIMNTDYSSISRLGLDLVDAYTGTGGVHCITANRLSYFLDLQGPSLAVDTACSSSLVATHLACQSLRTGESTLAIVGGVNLMLSPWGTIYFTKAGLMAADGRCKTFDARADGFVRGEGVAVLVLKLLSLAIADGDPVHALIIGSAVNQDGRTNGLTAPSKWSQMSALRQAYEQAGTSPSELQYVEAHGTGTAIGDPIEAMALGSVLKPGRDPALACAIGSVKTNIGHLEACAGLAGLIKVALMMKNRQVPASLNYQSPNPLIPFDQLALKVQTDLGPWPAPAKTMLAGVSSFGFGGTNAHVVVREADEARAFELPKNGSNRPYIIPLSARCEESLAALAGRFKEKLSETGFNGSGALDDICYTAGVRRNHHDYRLAIIGDSAQTMTESLTGYLAGRKTDAISTGRKSPIRRPKTVFVFCGQGPQWHAMGRQLFRQEKVYRDSLMRCDDLLKQIAGWSVVDELNRDEPDSRLSNTEIAQPALFSLQVSLAALWRSWGIEPDAVVGHSVGEVAAAHVAGSLTLEAAAKVIHHRARIMQRVTGRGRMASVEINEQAARSLLKPYAGRLSIAAINGPSSVVVSGDAQPLEEFVDRLAQKDVYTRFLPVDYAFHSHQIDPLCAELLDALGCIEAHAPNIQVVPTMASREVEAMPFDALYWAKQMRQPVLFAPAIQRLVTAGYDIFLEVGPHPVLAPGIKQSFATVKATPTVHHSLKRDEPERETMLKTLGRLYALGLEINWDGFYSDKGRCAQIPHYPWNHELFWLAPSDEYNQPEFRRGRHSEPTRSNHPLLGWRMHLAHSPETTIWETEVSTGRFPFIDDHRIQGAVVFPGTGYIEIAFAAAVEIFGAKPERLSDIRFHEALFLSDEIPTRIQVALKFESDSEASFSIHSLPFDSPDQDRCWVLHATGLAHRQRPARTTHRQIDISATRTSCREMVSGADFYSRMQRAGNEYGQAFRGVDELYWREGEAIARVRLPRALESDKALYYNHPALFDACGQVLGAALGSTSEQENGPFMPVYIGSIDFFDCLDDLFWSHARLAPVSDLHSGRSGGDLILADEQGHIIVEATDLKFIRLAQMNAPANHTQQWLLKEVWQPKPLSSSAAWLATPKAAGSVWVVLADSRGVAESIAALMESEGDRAIVVRVGDEFEAEAIDRFKVRPAKREDLKQVLDRLADNGLECSGFIHLWGVDARTTDESEIEQLSYQQKTGCGMVLVILQELAQRQWSRLPKIWIGTCGAQPVDIDDRLEGALASPLWGFGSSISNEFSSMWGAIVDLDPRDSAKESARQFLEQMRQPDGDSKIALRSATRHVARLIRHPASLKSETELRVKSDGAYLITGGLGGLGLEVSRWMVERGVRYMILISRTKMPPRHLWEDKIVADRFARQIDAITEMESAGATIHLASVDVSDEAEMTAFIKAYNEQGGPPITGVMHAAGIVDHNYCHNLSLEQLNHVLRPKIVGGWLLHQLFKETPLDFLVFFSSISSLVSSPGLAAYAAANAFLDALAHYRRARGRTCLSINWGPWAEVGMAARELADKGTLALASIENIPIKQGLELLGRLTNGDDAQLAVCSIDWPSFAKNHSSIFRSPYFTHFHKGGDGGISDSAGKLRRALDAAEPASRPARIRAFICEQVSKVLRIPIERLDLDRPLNLMGLDSLITIELKDKIETHLDIVFSMVNLLRGPTINQLTEQLLEQVEVSNPSVVASLDMLLSDVDRLSDKDVDLLLTGLLAEEAGE